MVTRVRCRPGAGDTLPQLWGCANKDPDQLFLLRRVRTRDPKEESGRAGAASRGWTDGEPAMGRQRLDRLKQQGKTSSTIRAVFQQTSTSRRDILQRPSF